MAKIGFDINARRVVMAAIVDGAAATRVEEHPVAGNAAALVRALLAAVAGPWQASVTGTEGSAVAAELDLPFVDAPAALLRGIASLHPEARTVIELGRERSRYYAFHNGDGQAPRLAGFATNSLCGAGGGALLEKMAPRLGFSSLAAFLDAAREAEAAVQIAGRCGVFAESDVVHHFQAGASSGSIAAGLCRMLATNFLHDVLKERQVHPPVVVIGEAGRNPLVIKALEEALGVAIVPSTRGDAVRAIGAALCATQRTGAPARPCPPRRGLESLPLAPLSPRGTRLPAAPHSAPRGAGGDRVMVTAGDGALPAAGFLGLDVGSVSTKAVLLDEEGRFVFGVYLRTLGQPIAAVREVVRLVGEHERGGRIRDRVRILGAGVTGSGRVVAGHIVGADLVRNEITAQASGAAYFFPDVDTVFEIGGQDSKFIALGAGRVVESEMNKVCAASTGSFLEEQARQLGVTVEGEFAPLALAALAPCTLSEKCAILMASSLESFRDTPLADRCAGLAYSICLNYLNRVAGRRPIGSRVVFQGAVAFNRAVVAGFETLLGREVLVPAYPHLTGAIGMGRLVRERHGRG